MSKVSVIISTYNRPDKVLNAIRSVLVQSHQDLEVIVVDDGSKKSLDVEKKISGTFSDSRLRYIRLPKNSGCQSVPKNEGIKQSTGDYIAFLDDDNTFRQDHLSALVRVLDHNQHIHVAYGDRMIHLPNGKSEVGVYLNYDRSVLLSRNYIDTSDSLIRRGCLEYVGGWDERYKRFLDWNLYIRLAKAGYEFLRVPTIITDYYITEDALSTKPPESMFDPYDLEIRLPYLKPTTEPKIAIYSITYDRLSYTKQAFDSLRKTAGVKYEHFVVDNGSKDGTQEWLKKNFEEDHLILNPDNKGISISSNQILDLIKGRGFDIIVKFDNDCMCLSDGWLKRMVDIWNSNHLMALSCYVQGLKDHPGGAERVGYGKICGEYVGITKHLGGICHFVSAKAYDKFRWPEDETLHGYQDLEFSNYLLAHNYQMGYLESFFVNHGPLGTEAQKKDFPDYFERRKLEKVNRYESTPNR